MQELKERFQSLLVHLFIFALAMAVVFGGLIWSGLMANPFKKTYPTYAYAPISVPVTDQIVPDDWNNLATILTKDGASYTTANGWIITVKSFGSDSVHLNAYYTNADSPLELKYNDGAWSGGDSTVRLVARNSPENGHFVEVWTHK